MSQDGTQPNHTGWSIPAPGPPGREGVLVLFLALLAAAVTLYRVDERDLFTAHEARAGCIARCMLESATWPADAPSPWLVPQFSPDAPPGLNYQKPPLYYWAIALASLPGGEVTKLTIRFPSAVSFVLLIIITFYLGKAMISVRAGLLAGLILLSTPKMLWWSRAAILDPMLAACVAGSLLFFFRAHRGLGGRWQYWLFWALAGLGMLVKATSLIVPLMTVGLYLVVRAREEGLWGPLLRIKPFSGPLVLLAVAAPWHVAAHVATGGEFTWVYWGTHVFGRATGTGGFEAKTHWWYYLAAGARDLFPWVVMLPGALVQPWRRVSRPHRGRVLFPGVWFVGCFLFFSAISFRKDEYLMVAYPGAALLIAYFLEYYLHAHREDAALRRWVEAAFWFVAVATLAVGAGILALALVPGVHEALLARLDNGTDRSILAALVELVSARVWVTPLLVAPMMAAALASVIAIRRGRPAAAVALMVCGTILAFVLFVVMIVPVLDEARGLGRFAAAVKSHAVRDGRETRVLLAATECHPLAFELSDRAKTLDALPSDLVPWLKQELADGRRWLVVMDRKAHVAGRWADPALAWRVVDEMPPEHRRPMVLLEPALAVGVPETKSHE
ncbi:MAG: glycosyltransferase family 39 protein [Acidobacteria bacterium]|nr:glycosyltransferase family 39 protein [Acidobacteriota bacterium]